MQVSGITLEMIDRRLQEITGVKEPFGNLSVIVLGDFYQLPPVRAHFAFTSRTWRMFQMVELTENMRQQGDRVSTM